jgi:hypothetical protein
LQNVSRELEERLHGSARTPQHDVGGDGREIKALLGEPGKRKRFGINADD